MILQKKVQKKRLYREYVSILNGIYELSNKEMDVFAALLAVDFSWPVEIRHRDIVDNSSRAYLSKTFSMNRSNVSRYVTKLKDKGILVLNKSLGWEINPILKRAFSTTPVNVTILLELIDEKSGI